MFLPLFKTILNTRRTGRVVREVAKKVHEEAMMLPNEKLCNGHMQNASQCWRPIKSPRYYSRVRL